MKWTHNKVKGITHELDKDVTKCLSNCAVNIVECEKKKKKKKAATAAAKAAAPTTPITKK